jgi:hypothetical protein
MKEKVTRKGQLNGRGETSAEQSHFLLLGKHSELTATEKAPIRLMALFFSTMAPVQYLKVSSGRAAKLSESTHGVSLLRRPPLPRLEG